MWSVCEVSVSVSVCVQMLMFLPILENNPAARRCLAMLALITTW